MNDEIIELTKSELKKYLKKAFEEGQWDARRNIIDFEEWYEDGEWIIDE